MSYVALYRKFRPQIFEDVKGQDHIVTTLKNQIQANRIGHAYLFTGTRGTGKTTVAKIFARAVNCEHPKEDGSPCCECEVCKSILAGNSMNVIEIDAASNNGVDNIRGIIEEVAYPPTEGKYKVYIIDEVHMLSTGAFNALLKTLEEPPSYVIFILATTEVQKIPITILSRVQRYDFRRISIDTIAARLTELMEKEQIDVEEKAIRYIAKAADGSMRDALSLLDQCIAFYLGQTLTYDNVLSVLGAVDTEIFSRLLRGIIAKDVIGVMKLIEDIIVEGRELSQFIIDFTWYIRNLLLVKSTDNMEDILDISSENMKLLKEEAQMLDDAVLMRYIRILSELTNELRYSTQKRVLVEVAMIKLCKPEMEQTYDSLIDRIDTLEQKLQEGGGGGISEERLAQAIRQAGMHSSSPQTGQAANASAGPVKKALPDAIPEDVQKAAGMWNKIVADNSDAITKIVLKNAFVTVDPDNPSQLLMVYDMADKQQAMSIQKLQSPGQMDAVEEIIEKAIGKHVKLKLVVNDSQHSREKLYTDAVSAFEKKINMEIVTEDF